MWPATFLDATIGAKAEIWGCVIDHGVKEDDIDNIPITGRMWMSLLQISGGFNGNIYEQFWMSLYRPLKNMKILSLHTDRAGFLGLVTILLPCVPRTIRFEACLRVTRAKNYWRR